MENEDVTRRLDTIISLLKLAHQDALGRVRDHTLADGVAAAVLEATATEYVASGNVKKTISKATGQSEKTVQRRISELVAMGALEKRPTGPAAYRSTGII